MGSHRGTGLGRRLIPTIAAAAVLAVLAGACTDSGTSQGVAEAGQALDDVAGRLAAVEVEASRLTASDAAFLPDPPEGQITLQIRFTNATDGTIGVYAPTEATGRLFAMESIPAGQPIPRGEAIKEGIVFAEPGELVPVELVYENPTDQDITFMSIAPTIDPAVAHPFAYARCFCAAIPFTAPAGGGWYRTIAVGAAPQVPPGAKVVVTWPVETYVGGENADA